MNRAQILAEIAEAYKVREQRPFEFTRKEFVEACGLSYERASRILKNMVESGELCKASAIVEGRRAWVYWRQADEEEFYRTSPDISTEGTVL